jgi:hypothetical protein
MMSWQLYLGSFLMGGLIFWLLSRYYILRILKREKNAYKKEMKHSVRFWFLKPFPLIEVLKKHKDIYRTKEDKLDNSLREISRKLERTTQQLKSHQNRAEALEKENLRLKNLINNSGILQKSPSQDLTRNENKKQPGGNHRNRSVSLYFSIPEADGFFYAERGEPVYDERKFYRIIFSGESEKGEIHFVSGQYDRKAIENVDYYLFPVCEVENMSQRNNASMVIQKEAGCVLKISGKWIIEKKITVKLI